MAGKQVEQNGLKLTFTCKNARFATDISKGKKHGQHSDSAGSVFDAPLVLYNGASLWLEHVVDHKNNDGIPYYWLMWYDSKGIPTVPLSGILSKYDLIRMQSMFAEFIPA